MLQFITHPSSRFTIAEEVRMVIEGGCRWVQLRLKDLSDDEVRHIAEEIIPLCKESGTILILDDRVELANELRIHGVHLGKQDMPVAEAREYLGPHAIIGATANTIDDITVLKGIDVDYIGLGPFRFTETKKRLSPVLGIDGYRSIIAAKREAGIELPVVAIGGISLDDVTDIMATGVDGLAVSGSIINASNPVEYTAKIIELIQQSKQ